MIWLRIIWSLTEAEYVAASMAACEGMWLRKLLLGLFECEVETTVVHCDNQSGIRLSENPVFHDRSKHRHQVPLHEIVFIEEPFSWSKYRQMSRWQTFSPRHFVDTVLWSSGIRWGCYRIPSLLRGSVKLATTWKVFLHACVLACRRLKSGNQLY